MEYFIHILLHKIPLNVSTNNIYNFEFLNEKLIERGERQKEVHSNKYFENE